MIYNHHMRKITSFLFGLFLCGCAATMQSHLNDIQNNFANGDFTTTTESVPSDQNNLDLLINGTALFLDDKYTESDKTFEEFNKRNISETSTSFSREATGLLLGQGANSYKPYMMDSLFVSYYQIWDLLALHDWANARVVINQSYQRQQDMSREYKKLIENNKKELSENDQVAEFIKTNSNDWLAFRDIMNPALMYLSGIYFLNDGDFDNAITYLKRANGMVPDNKYIKQDLELAQKRIRPTNTSWKFIETGFAPRLRESNASIYIFGIGLVQFTFSDTYQMPNYTIPQNSEILANVDALFMTEYNEYKANEVLRAYAAAVSKTTAQTLIYNSNSDYAALLGIMSSIYTAASSNADVRTWATLPKYIYVERYKTKDKTNNLIYNREINGKIVNTKTIELKKGERK